MTNFEDPYGPVTAAKRMLTIFRKTRERGCGWLVRRVRRELSVPSFTVSRFIRDNLATVEKYMVRLHPRVAPPKSRDVLYFFLDLEVCPITYDCVSFLAGAEVVRRRLGLDCIQIVIVPGRVDGLREERFDYELAVNADARRWRLANLVIPLFRLLPSCWGYTYCASREEAHSIWFKGASHVYPTDYSVTFPTAPNLYEPSNAARSGETILPLLRSPVQATSYVRQFLEARAKGRQVIAINLRNYAFMRGRNSNDHNWISFVRQLDREKWMPVFVRDTDVALGPLPSDFAGYTVFEAASFNVELRSALFELADLTMSVAQGPMALCWYNARCRYAMFVRPNSSPHTTPDAIYDSLRIEEGGAPPFAVDGQRWIWTSDDLPEIRKVFEDMTGSNKGP